MKVLLKTIVIAALVSLSYGAGSLAKGNDENSSAKQATGQEMADQNASENKDAAKEKADAKKAEAEAKAEEEKAKKEEEKKKKKHRKRCPTTSSRVSHCR